MCPHEKAGNLAMTGVQRKEEFILPKHLASFHNTATLNQSNAGKVLPALPCLGDCTGGLSKAPWLS